MLDIMSSAARHRRQQLDTVSSAKTTVRHKAAGDPDTRHRICEAALRLIIRHGGADVTLASVAKAAGVSRQALYLHFADRAALFLAVVQYADEKRGVPEAVQRVQSAPTGVATIEELVAMQSRLNPEIWPLARLFESVRRSDRAAEQSWQDRLASRLRGSRAIIARLSAEGALREGMDADVAADLLWTLTSLRTWEELVLLRGWSASQYEERLTDTLLTLLVSRDGPSRTPDAS
jgi:AcrR family transcriptional regulator